MIIGHGMIARAFAGYADDPSNIIFASGVSNSSENDQPQFNREKQLLVDTIDQMNQGRLIYFSSFSVTLKNSPYTAHKLKMEDLIRSSKKDYLICRVTNVVGTSHNPNTLLNYLVNRISNHMIVYMQYKCVRNLLDIDDLYIIVSDILSRALYSNQIINIGYPYSYRVPEIISEIESFLHKKANIVFSDVEENQPGEDIDLGNIPSFKQVDKNIYLHSLLHKYYSSPAS